MCNSRIRWLCGYGQGRLSSRQQAFGLFQRRCGGRHLDAGQRILALRLLRLQIDAQAGGQIGFTKPEGFVEEGLVLLGVSSFSVQ